MFRFFLLLLFLIFDHLLAAEVDLSSINELIEAGKLPEAEKVITETLKGKSLTRWQRWNWKTRLPAVTIDN